MIVAPPRTVTRGSFEANAATNAAKGAPYKAGHDTSAAGRMQRARQPETLPGYLRWYAEAWDDEVPTTLHKVEVWASSGEIVDGSGDKVSDPGGSKLGTRAWGNQFRRYMENVDSECDADGFYIRPMHAALSRMERRWPLTARSLFAVAQSGYDWRGVAERGHWAEEMFYRFLMDAFAALWKEYRDEVVRLT